VNSAHIPFFVLPGGNSFGCSLGDVGLVWNTETDDNCFAIYADIGPRDQIGEGSMALAKALALDPDPKKGGTEAQKIVYLVFPQSLPGWHEPDEWWQVAADFVKQWGGLARLQKICGELYGFSV
jgi:Fungal chitosanase of glycosyl hydrolase group 75